MLLDAKSVMDDALPNLEDFRELIAEVNHDDFERVVARFQADLAGCDVQEQYLSADVADDCWSLVDAVEALLESEDWEKKAGVKDHPESLFDERMKDVRQAFKEVRRHRP
jgi:hypothetical protein